MVQQCRLSVFVPSVTCTMRALARHTSLASQEAAHQMASYALSASLTMAEAESPPTRCDFDSKALKLTEKAQVLMSLPESEKAAAEPLVSQSLPTRPPVLSTRSRSISACGSR